MLFRKQNEVKNHSLLRFGHERFLYIILVIFFNCLLFICELPIKEKSKYQTLTLELNYLEYKQKKPTCASAPGRNNFGIMIETCNSQPSVRRYYEIAYSESIRRCGRDSKKLKSVDRIAIRQLVMSDSSIRLSFQKTKSDLQFPINRFRFRDI